MPTSRFPARATARRRRLVLLNLLTAIAVLVPTAAACAEDISVTNLQDHGAGSLREAIVSANVSPGADSISFAAGATGTIGLETSLPEIESDVEIVGPGQSALTVRRVATSEPIPFRVFTIDSSTVSISGMTISDGDFEFGGGISSQGPLTLTRVTVSGNEATGSTPEGAGILVAGSRSTLTLRESVVSGNVARASGANGATATGAGVAAEHGGLILRSTISGNTAEATAPSGAVQVDGAGVVLRGGSGGAIEQSTINGNSARAGGGSPQAVAEGGGAFTGGGVTITGSTVTGNSITAAGAALGANVFGPGETTVRDTIVSNAQGAPNCSGVSSGGFNIEDGSSCGLTQAGDRSGVDPGLAPSLADNGGPTPTFALAPTSIAIDHGSAFGAVTDQRGVPRPLDLGVIANPAGGDGSDVGAFEALTAAVPSPPAKDTRPPDTRIAHGPAHKSAARLARFRFSSTEAGSHFECKLDKGAFKRCASPFKHKVKVGKHTFQVRAIDAAGNVDRTPARYAWQVKAPRPPRPGAR